MRRPLMPRSKHGEETAACLRNSLKAAAAAEGACPSCQRRRSFILIRRDIFHLSSMHSVFSPLLSRQELLTKSCLAETVFLL